MVQQRQRKHFESTEIFQSAGKTELLQLKVESFSCNQKAGILRHYVNKWSQITEDEWILKAIAGYEIEFTQKPFQTSFPVTPNFKAQERALIDIEIKNMLNLGAIQISKNEKDQFISNLFLVKKKNGKFRPVINLRKLNKFVEYFHFKMETLQHVTELLKRDAYFTSIDLENAYFSIPISKNSRKYLKFI